MPIYPKFKNENLARQDQIRPNNVSEKMWGIQRGVDAKSMSESDFNKKYVKTLHQYQYENNPEYRRQIENQNAYRKANDPNYAEVNLPKTDLRRKDNITPNQNWMAPKVKGQDRQSIVSFNENVISSGAPIPGLQAVGKVPSIYGATKQGVQQVGKYLTTQTPLKNTYNILPEGTFSGYSKLKNANKSYRVAGIDAYDDFVESGVLRSVQQGVPDESTFLEKVMSRPTGFPSFQKGYADLNYLPDKGGVVFETSLPTFKRGEINPVTGYRIKGRHYAHRVIDPKTGETLSSIPAENISVYDSKPHWLKGYKQIEKPKLSFKSEIDWRNWNKEIPRNTQLMQEYNAIEQQAKANGTWMKNPDGSEFRGRPEQFIQQNSKNFKKAFGDSPTINPDGSFEPVVHSTNSIFDTFDKSFFGKTDEGYHGQGFYLSPIQRVGHEGDFYERPYKWINDKTVQGTHNYGKNKMMLYAKPDKISGNFPVNPFTEFIVDLNKPQNIKSAVGNNGMFDMTNPNIYKGVIPFGIGLGTLQQKQKTINDIKE